VPHVRDIEDWDGGRWASLRVVLNLPDDQHRELTVLCLSMAVAWGRDDDAARVSDRPLNERGGRLFRGARQDPSEVLTAADAKLAKCALQVVVDGPHRNDEPICDLAAAQPGGGEQGDLTLAKRQLVGGGVSQRGGSRALATTLSRLSDSATLRLARLVGDAGRTRRSSAVAPVSGRAEGRSGHASN
jgi:hypothetical protein